MKSTQRQKRPDPAFCSFCILMRSHASLCFLKLSGAAVAAAKATDVAVVFVGAMSGEGADRKSLNLGEGAQKSK